MEKLESILNKVVTTKSYYMLASDSIQSKVNHINYQTNISFWSLAAIVSIVAGYSVYKYLKFLKRGY